MSDNGMDTLHKIQNFNSMGIDEALDFLDSIDLSPYDFRLMFHFLNVGHCNETVRELGKICKISPSKVSTSKRRLAAVGLLQRWGVPRDYFDRNGFVYLIRSENGLFKIGQSVDPKDRLKGLKTGSPVKLELIHTIETNDMSYAENALHQLFMHERLHGEWFELTLKQVDYVKGLSRLNTPEVIR